MRYTDKNRQAVVRALIVLMFLSVIPIHAVWGHGGKKHDAGAFTKSQAFFWLHIPGGGLFMGVFLSVSARALLEMWLRTGDKFHDKV